MAGAITKFFIVFSFHFGELCFCWWVREENAWVSQKNHPIFLFLLNNLKTYFLSFLFYSSNFTFTKLRKLWVGFNKLKVTMAVEKHIKIYQEFTNLITSIIWSFWHGGVDPSLSCPRDHGCNSKGSSSTFRVLIFQNFDFSHLLNSQPTYIIKKKKNHLLFESLWDVDSNFVPSFFFFLFI